MIRSDSLSRLSDSSEQWDILVIGGGATGLGIAVDAATRGYRTALVERGDFAEGTSSRSTKLIHGGVRYLRGGEVSLVRESLRERGRLLQNAGGLVQPLPFVVPAYRWYERFFYGVGLSLYDILAGKLGIHSTGHLNTQDATDKVPNLSQNGLRGGTLYWDGQFDDARLAIALARTASESGAALVNHLKVDELIHEGGKVKGVLATDQIDGRSFEVRASVVVNATGVFTDSIRKMDDSSSTEMMTTSQGIHIVLDGEFLGGDTAIMIPNTDDGRVLFAIPWHNRVLLGTTDTGGVEIDRHPVAREDEINYLLKHMARYLQKAPERSDVRSIFAGLRPLVRRPGASGSTSKISRSHQIVASKSGLLTVAGGKWTTYRQMAEEAVDRAAELGDLGNQSCETHDLALLNPDVSGDGARLCPELPYSMSDIERGVTQEMAMTLDDVLSRRTRSLLLDAKATLRVAPEVVRTMSTLLARDDAWAEEELKRFSKLAETYIFPTSHRLSESESEGS
tara:strand:- start:2296 stop:3822 length:1527 start_codon:yes stop_codon:yes gene_type:complete